MVLDYRERKPVNKNRPKSKPVGLLIIAFGAVACCSFVLGVLADRFLLPHSDIKAVDALAPQSAPSGESASNQQAAAGNSSVPGKQNVYTSLKEPSLTFYETLPKGGKVILGSGLNPKQPSVPVAAPAKSAVVSQPRVDQTQKGQPVTGAESKPGKAEPISSPNGDASIKGTPPKKVAASKGKYLVQVASARERKEAEVVRSALQAKGFAAYIVESHVDGKGTWFRVRVGKQLDQAAAGNLVNQIGKGAIAIPE